MTLLAALAGLMAGAVLLLLLLPAEGLGLSKGVAYLAEEAGFRQDTLIQRLEAYQQQLLAGTGLTISARKFMLLQSAAAGIAFVAVTPMLGIPSGLLSAGGVFLVAREMLVSRREARLLTFNIQFREALTSLTNSLRAGQSLPSALETCVRDLGRLFKRDDEPVLEELRRVVEEIKLGVSAEDALLHLKQRVPIEEVAQFVDAAIITRNKGGNLAEVMTAVSRLIADRLSVLQEIQVLTTEKRFEGALVSFLPVVMLIVLRLLAPEYLQPLLDAWWGEFAIGAGMFMVLLAYLVSRHLTRIEV